MSCPQITRIAQINEEPNPEGREAFLPGADDRPSVPPIGRRVASDETD